MGELFSPVGALAPLTLCSPDPSDGVLGSGGCGGRGSPLVGHPPGCTGRAAGAGTAGAAHVEGEAWGGWGQWGLGFPVKQAAFHAVVLIHPLPHLLSICTEHLPCLYQGLCWVLDILEISQCRSCPWRYDSLVEEGSLVVRRH